MTKKDEKDADRPHYYSQFWLDVAAGRKVIGAPKTEDGTDQADADISEPIPLARKSGRANAGILPADGYRETRAPAAVADEAYDEDEDEFSLPEDEEPDTINEVSDEDIPTIVDDTPEELAPNIEPEPLEEEEEESEEDEEFYDEEEDEDEEWPARGRKKPKPGRQAKVPKAPAKKPRRGGGRF